MPVSDALTFVISAIAIVSTVRILKAEPAQPKLS